MSLFDFSNNSGSYSAIIDIGSGSVLAAIIFSKPTEKYPKIVWSHREHAPLRNIDSLEKSAKAVMTSLINTSILLDNEGRKQLREFDPKAKITNLQCTVSAPWSYTVTKTINYKQEEPFEVTKQLIEELLVSIEQTLQEELNQNEKLVQLGLQTIAKHVMQTSANGYFVHNPEGNIVSELKISQATVITQKYLIDSITDFRDKIFPDSKIQQVSFILVLYIIAKEFLNKTQNICLVDVTYEATEIGIVRDQILTYSTHTPFGSFSLSREISEITKVPLHEAFAELHTENPYAFTKKLNSKQKEDVNAVFEAYIERLSSLFRETGDALSVPKHVTIHTNSGSEALFSDLVEKAIKRNIKTEPYITNISEEIIKKLYENTTEISEEKIKQDTALLLSAQFFHIRNKLEPFEYF